MKKKQKHTEQVDIISPEDLPLSKDSTNETLSLKKHPQNI